ncbi:lasso peptide biosynthesis B2 protein [Paenibacillus sp. F411]|uniref:Microcin J25-processing protein McjB C-terminal domain-containing protein n=1 Tax=Paenibacillus algicola TaxID=2565926 RepID=A0A4P8XQG3_9BACL|nr:MULTISPECIES: lasso peptide biosynthesis B2 protein [Paenibacillus]MBO2943783.1 lasso peptide biosynthesis B2 protein [Paenibacillus sp. F411]QCT04070.1 hypothetical protein E6C60_3359 [Paenibacillus algicola]
MRRKTKLQRILNSSLSVKMLHAEAYLCLAWGRIFKLLPFAKVSASLGAPMKETSAAPCTEQELRLLKQVSKAVHRMSRYTWWESQCLVKAVAAMVMLERRGVESTLYLGSGRDAQGRMAAHAWLRSGSYLVTGAEGHEQYAVVGIFAKQPSRKGLKPERSGV